MFKSIISITYLAQGSKQVGNWPFNPAGNITCNLPIPDVLNCDDIPKWKQFRVKMNEYARKGYPVDPEMYEMAASLAYEYDAKDYPPQAFLTNICRVGGAGWPPADNFCLYGFVCALFVRARHLMYSEDPEARRMAQQDWVYGTLVLGKEGSVDFIESSGWPVNVLDFFININQTEFAPNFFYEEQVPIPKPVVPLDQIRWSREMALEFPMLNNLKGDLPAGELLIAVMGSHATLSNEPVTMIKQFIKEDIKPVFYGLEARWCHLLQMCDHGDERLGLLFKASEKDPFAYPWERMENEMKEVWNTDNWLNSAKLLICTEPVFGCLLIKAFALMSGNVLPMLGYMGVALMQGVPPTDVDKFWDLYRALVINDQHQSVVLSSNNLILSQQVYYQTGQRIPVVRAHGFYTGVNYAPTKQSEVLFWRAPLYVYDPLTCAMEQFFEKTPEYPIRIKTMGDGISLSYAEAASYRAVILVPWDHALMTFYELYSMQMPLFMPATNWMYRFLYQRGQLSVGEPLYQSVMPGYSPPFSEFAEFDEEFKMHDSSPANSPGLGMSSAKAARGVAVDMISRVLAATTLEEAKTHAGLAMDLLKDQAYFLALAENRTHDEDLYTSRGKVFRTYDQPTQQLTFDKSKPWHPYTPWQISEKDSNDFVRKRRGGWWLRRGVRYDAMRYWSVGRVVWLVWESEILNLGILFRCVCLVSFATIPGSKHWPAFRE